ncbi:hypothetical protein [Lewinella sp. IMCC34183]|uniref:hypothetical protein n=1 Tax=Lewinella sp. IMCC34183 TaxID=2248762 RepID=UPI000E2498C3|nr:hypothetical protein [Lewinella sp. IMCC34183]
MHASYLTSLLLFFAAASTLSAQSLTGQWTYALTTPSGETLHNLLIVKDDGTITIDMGTDGEVDVVSEYTIDGNEITVHATEAEDPCYDTPGVYRFTREGDTVTLTAIDDPCEARNQGAPTTMTLVE